MKNKKTLLIGYKGRKIKVNAKECSLFGEFKGLMFSKKEKAEILLFNFSIKQKIRIHSFFVFYDFIAVWLDDKNKAVDIKIVKPFKFCVSPKEECFKLVEIPLNRKNRKISKKFFPEK
jgi:uncharacterized membrane protein (UPF0127 family)